MAAANNGASDPELARKIEEYQARERVYRAGLLEQDAQVNQLRRMSSDIVAAYGDVSRAAIRGALADPTQNMEVLLLRQKAREKDEQIKQLREELEANRFDQQAPAGQALMKKCRALLEENRELGEQIREEKNAELRAALQDEQKLTADLQDKLMESVEFMKELQQENEKLQGTMSRVAGRLREARAELVEVRKERAEAKSKKKREKEQQKAAGASAVAPAPTPSPAAAAAAAAAEGAMEAAMNAAASAASAPAPRAVLTTAAEAAEKPEKKRKKSEKDKEEKKSKKAKSG